MILIDWSQFSASKPERPSNCSCQVKAQLEKLSLQDRTGNTMRCRCVRSSKKLWCFITLGYPMSNSVQWCSMIGHRREILGLNCMVSSKLAELPSTFWTSPDISSSSKPEKPDACLKPAQPLFRSACTRCKKTIWIDSVWFVGEISWEIHNLDITWKKNTPGTWMIHPCGTQELSFDNLDQLEVPKTDCGPSFHHPLTLFGHSYLQVFSISQIQESWGKERGGYLKFFVGRRWPI